jgi:hypothetical protein
MKEQVDEIHDGEWQVGEWQAGEWKVSKLVSLCIGKVMKHLTVERAS